jgi:thiol-disulfide isomerase/thioredoxin
MGLPLGQPAPSFTLPQLDGGLLFLDALRSVGKPLVLVFSDPQCGPCMALLPQLSAWQRQHEHELTLLLVRRGTVDDNRAKIGTLRMKSVVLQADREVALAYLAQVTPSAVRVDRDGPIGSALALGELDIAALVQEAAANSHLGGDDFVQSFVARGGHPA